MGRVALEGLCYSINFLLLTNIAKVTIHPDFTRTVPNFDGLFWESNEVFGDAELS